MVLNLKDKQEAAKSLTFMRNAIYWALFLGNTSLIPQFYDRRLAFIIIMWSHIQFVLACVPVSVNSTHSHADSSYQYSTNKMLYIQPFSNGNLCLWLKKKKKIHPNTFLIPLSMLPFVGINYSRPLSLHWGINWNFMMIPRRSSPTHYNLMLKTKCTHI